LSRPRSTSSDERSFAIISSIDVCIRSFTCIQRTTCKHTPYNNSTTGNLTGYHAAISRCGDVSIKCARERCDRASVSAGVVDGGWPDRTPLLGKS
jgi:hypothetical protein